jgi:hydroxypyruvate isomerase
MNECKIRQSLAYWCLNVEPWGWDIERICEAATELGCSSVELVPVELWPVLKRYGLTCALAMNGMPDPVFSKGLNQLRYHEEIFARTKAAIDQAADFGVPNVIAFTGYAEGISREDGAANCVRGLSELGAYAGPRNVTVCLEHLNTRDDSGPMMGHPGYQGDDIDYCADIVRRADSPHVKLLFDVYHVQIMNGDVIRRLRQYRDLLGHIHTAGNPGRAELDDRQEIQYAGVFRTLREIGYRGFVGHEFIPTRDPKEGLRQAVSMCDGV